MVGAPLTGRYDASRYMSARRARRAEGDPPALGHDPASQRASTGANLNSSVGSAIGASGLNQALSWMCDAVT